MPPYTSFPSDAPLALKIVIAGGFGVGKTTFVGAVSEIAPLCTEEILTQASEGTDSLEHVADKKHTTVAMDFGRITIPSSRPMVLLLFGTPGQERFRSMWDDLSHGAIGAVVLADTRRLPDSFPSVNYFESRGLPFVVAVNEFDDERAPSYTPEEVREALELAPQTPVLMCDARDAGSAKAVLVGLTEQAIDSAHVAPASTSTAFTGAM